MEMEMGTMPKRQQPDQTADNSDIHKFLIQT